MDARLQYTHTPSGRANTGNESDVRNNTLIFGIPTIKQMKLTIIKFGATEPYKGLGTYFGEWDIKFMRQIAIAQINFYFWWEGEYNIDCLLSHLDGKSLCYIETQSPVLMKEYIFLEHVTMKV
jgi:hypothetical protein